MKKTTIWIALIAGIAFIGGSALFSSSVRDLGKAPKRITVKGMAEKNFTSDLIIWTARYKSQMPDLRESYAELKRRHFEVKEFLEKNGVPASAVTYSSVEIDKQYNNRYLDGIAVSTFLGYELTQSVTITSKDIALVEKVSRDITELINEGMEIYSDSPKYYYTKLDELKISMLEAASADARRRAEVIARGSGSGLGSCSEAQMGVFQIVGLNSNEDYSWGGSFNTSSKEKTASITVQAKYRLR